MEGTLKLCWFNKDASFVFPIVATTIDCSLYLAYMWCTSQAALDCEWLPQGLKFRDQD